MLCIIPTNHLSNLTKKRLEELCNVFTTVMLEINKSQMIQLYKHRFLKNEIYMRDQMDALEWSLMNKKKIVFMFDGIRVDFRENSFYPKNYVDNEIFKNVDVSVLQDKYCDIINKSILNQHERTAIVVGSAHVEHIEEFCNENNIEYVTFRE